MSLLVCSALFLLLLAAGIPIAYHPAADRRSWGHMKQFFKEIFGDAK